MFVKDGECVALLQWALPQLELRWDGFRRVRGQVCKRIARRARELGLANVAAYRSYLEAHPAEWGTFDGMCRVSISRFCRDRGVFALLSESVLPELALRASERGDRSVRLWSAGCAGGEEPYSLAIAWSVSVAPDHPDVTLRVLATDADSAQLERARAGVYPSGTLRDVPPSWLHAAVTRSGAGLRVRDEHRAAVELLQQDLRREMPAGVFDLVMCRNVAFTYFGQELQRRVLDELLQRVRGGGFLVIGKREQLPHEPSLTEVAEGTRVYRRVPAVALGEAKTSTAGEL